MWSSAKIFWNGPTSLSGPVRSHEARPKHGLVFMSWPIQPFHNPKAHYLATLQKCPFRNLLVSSGLWKSKNLATFFNVRSLICRNEDASKKIVATGILIFDFELFIGDRFPEPIVWKRSCWFVQCYWHDQQIGKLVSFGLSYLSR